MRIECKPEEATIARVGEVEFRKEGSGHWWSPKIGYLSLDPVKAMGATFEKEIEPPEGYRLATEEDKKKPKPNGALMIWPEKHGWVPANDDGLWGTLQIYAIPLKKSCVVEGHVILRGPKDESWALLDSPMEDGTEVYILPKEGTVRYDGVISNGLFITSDRNYQAQVVRLQGKRVEVLVREVE